jgi:transcriptional regulator GlxA family with amidase domain
MTTPHLPLHVAILVFDDVDVLDFAGPYEVFTTANRVYQREHGQSLFEVQTVALSMQSVRARAGLQVLPDTDYAACPTAQVLIVPGGVVTAVMQCQATLAWIAKLSAKTQITASVCTGSFLLAASGIITTERVTTHWEDVADLRAAFPLLAVCDDQRWVDNGHTVTSAGISAGLDMSLHLVAQLAGAALAVSTARQMDYAWNAQA